MVNQPISPAISVAIHRLRLPLVMLVILLHTLPHLQFLQNFTPLAGLLWCLEAIARTAVPLFCFFSAYLFFSKFQWDGHWFIKQMWRKLQQLGVPLLVWNLLVWGAGYSLVTLGYGGIFQHTADFSVTTFGDWLALLFGYNRNPLVYPLWFIRDLLLLFLLSPLFFLCWRYSRWLLLVCFTPVFLLQAWPWFQPALVSTYFFCLGAFAALANVSFRLSSLQRKLVALGCVLYAGLVWVADPAQAVSWEQQLQVLGILQSIASQLFLLGTVLLCWDLVLGWEEWPAARCTKHAVSSQQLSQATFFVFAAHEPLLTLLAKFWQRWLQPSFADLTLLLWPWLLTLLLLAIYRWCVQPFRWLSLALVGRS